MRHIYNLFERPFNLILFIGAAISIFFGFIIPTGKVIVGLGIIKFVMPVALVGCVNAGIFLSGLMLLKYVTKLSPIVLIILFILTLLLLGTLYRKSRKLNTVAVLIGAVGYLMIYFSLISLSIQSGMIVPVILYAIAILLFVMLVGIGIKANLHNPRVHWVIEISNVICQMSVALATILLFR